MAAGGRRFGRTLLVVLLILIVLAIAADRIGVVVAEHAIADKASEQLADEDITADGKPSVSIGGFPFLTQVAAGHYDTITIKVNRPTSNGVALNYLNLVATGVDAPTGAVLNGTGTIEAAKVTGTGEIAWSSVTQMVDLGGLKQYGIEPSSLRINATSDNRIQISAPVSAGDESFTAVATGTISVHQDVLHIAIDDVRAQGSTVPTLLNVILGAIKKDLTFDARIPALPYHMVLQSIRANATGVTVTATATGVVLGS